MSGRFLPRAAEGLVNRGALHGRLLRVQGLCECANEVGARDDAYEPSVPHNGNAFDVSFVHQPGNLAGGDVLCDDDSARRHNVLHPVVLIENGLEEGWGQLLAFRQHIEPAGLLRARSSFSWFFVLCQ